MLKKKALSSAVLMSLFGSLQANGINDQLIVKYKNNGNPIVVESVDHMENLSQLAGVNLQHGRFMHDGAQVILLDKNYSDKDLETIIENLKLNDQIEYVEEDQLLQAVFAPNDTFYALQWHYHEAVGGINAEAAWDITTGAGVNIAVLDTGITNHTDLNTNVIGGYDMISNVTVANDGNGRDADPSDPGDWTTANQCGFGSPPQDQDSSWHGTHVAGTVAAVTDNNDGVAGVAFDARIVPVRVLGTCGGLTSDIADAMVWASGGAVAGVPANPDPAQVLNLSLGGSGACSATSQNAINTAVANGAVVVVASGNSNADVVNFNPGNCNNVISVAATDRNADRAYYSNFGNLIDIAAPGGDVTAPGGQDGVASTLNDGTTVPGAQTYVYYQGTSMAAPHVAGVAGLMYSVNPGLTPAQVEQEIKNTARAFPGGSSCNTNNCGAGIIDAAAAVTAVNLGPMAQLTANNNTLDVCTTDGNATFNLTLTDFDAITNMSSSGCPGGGSCSFSTDPVISPTTTTDFNITGLGSVTPNSYNLVATGTDAVDANITDSVNLTLNVFATAGSPGLSAPADGAVGVTVTPTLTWGAVAGAVDYDIDIATDSGFSNIVDSATGITGTSYTVSSSLTGNTNYFWRVTANNNCGSGVSSTFDFTTANEVCTVYSAIDLPLAISSGAPPTVVTSTLSIADSGSINDVNVVNFVGTHTWMGDLTFDLEGPTTTSVSLRARSCGNTDNWDIEYDDEAASAASPCPPTDGLTYQPAGNLSDFDGTDLQGDWLMTVEDFANQDGGSFNSWGLQICYTPAAVNTDPVANNDSPSTNEDTLVSVDVLGNDTDADGDTLSVTSCGTATNGNVVQNGNNCDYTPNQDYNGADSFTYDIFDGNGGSDTGTVNVTVDAVNDDPVAADNNVNTNEDTLVSVDVLNGDSDVDGDTLSVTACGAASNGNVVQNGNNCDYTPNQDYTGADSFTYDISDGNGGTDTAIVNVTVDAVNDDPVAADNNVNTNEDTLVSVDVLNGDSDADGDTLSVAACGAASNGNVVQNGNNCDYTPNQDYNGADSFTYDISDGNGGTDSATVNVTVDAVNDDPVAADNNVNTNEDTLVSVDVLNGDSDVEGDTLSVTACNAASNGNVVQNGNNCDYTPNQNYNGADSFTYDISDGNGGTATATVNVTVNATNDNPVAVDNNVNVDEDTLVSVDVLDGDSDVDGDTLSLSSCGAASNGLVAQNGDNCDYTPNPNYNGSDSFTYDISDGNGGTDSATVNITVNAVNDAPNAVDNNANVDEDSSIAINVLAGDTDVDGDTLSVTSCGAASNGNVVQNGNSCEYSPNANYNGADSFTYSISDGNGGSDSATVNITVNAVNDAPNAVDNNANVDEDSSVAINVLAGVTDVDGDTLSVTSCGAASNGNVVQNGNSCEYSPNANYNGADSFTYSISDGNGGTDSATVNITVNAVNDAPNAVDNNANVDEDSSVAVNVLAGDTDVDGDTLSVTSCGAASNGNVVQNGNSCEYSPNANYNGADSFTYSISDGNGGSDSATVNITVNAVNDAPNAVDNNANVDEDSSVAVNVLAGDTDVDGDTLSVTSCGAASNGNVVQNGNSCEYSPNANYNGADSFTYSISDGNGGSDSATVNMTVNAVNDEPNAFDNNANTDEDTLVSVDVLGNDSDPDGDNLSLTSCGAASNGNVVQNGNNCDYTPNQDFNGSDSFTYGISDGNGGSDSATVNVTINAINDDPVAADNNVNTNEDTLVSVDVLDGDSDVDGDNLSLTSCGAASNGNVVQNGNNCDYTPNQDFNGADSFTYSISDGNGGSDSATVNVTVNASNDDPVAADNNSNVNEDDMVSVDVLAGDSDADGDNLTVTSCGAASNGNVVQNGNNCDYTPDADFNGADSFSYDISDGNGGTDTATVNVTVASVNDQPSMTLSANVHVPLSEIGNNPSELVACQFNFGPANESGQSVADMVVGIQSDADGILSGVDVDNNGNISYNFTGNSGVAQVTVALQDDGGTANGGVDTSQTQVINVHVQDYIFRSSFDLEACQ